MPKVFISYSWEDDSHKSWVRDLAMTLRKDGVEVILDQWDLSLGDSLTKFMETSISESDYVLIICTPIYKDKSDKRIGGVGYEESIITAQSMYVRKKGKYIPILRRGNWIEAAPTWLLDKMYEDLSGDPYSETNYIHLLATLHNFDMSAPPVGRVPIEKFENIFNNGSIKRNQPQIDKKVLNSVDYIMRDLEAAKTIGECKILDNKLSNIFDEKSVRYYLFNGSPRQRNYAALYFKRRGKQSLLEEAYAKGKIDKIQAFSR